MTSQDLTFEVGSSRTVSALWLRPGDARFVFVLAHGAGAGMRHPFMADVAEGLAERQVATLRYQFPYMEAGKARPDPPGVAMAAVQAAVEQATTLAPELPVVAGGKSFGGRMTSTAAAGGKVPQLRGVVFLGFPLHAPNKPSDARAAHLFEVGVPMLFLQGTRDALSDLTLLRPVIKKIGSHATLHVVNDGDHSFKVPKRAGRSVDDVMRELVDATVEWLEGL